MLIGRRHRKGEQGQILVLCAICLVVLLLFVGLAVDFGLAYVTKASLGKAVDAAALTATRYSALGPTQSTALAKSAFATNYGTSGRDYARPVVNITYTADTDNNTLVNVNASATIKTFFIGLLPSFRTLSVSSFAQGKAMRVGLTLVLDRSGSMQNDGGADSLPGAVSDFIGYFDNVKDSMAVVTFASNVTVAVPMRTGNFVAPVTSLINSMNRSFFGGGTFSDGALQQALTQENLPAVPGNVQKVVVFFTDGGANAIQNSLICSGKSDALKNAKSVTWTMGGYDTPDVGFMTPASGALQCDINSQTCCTATFPSASQSKSVAPNWTSNGPAVTPWSQGTTLVPITYSNVQADALYRAIGDANAMRAEGITVYSIGLGSAPNPVDPVFLCEIANDPGCSPLYDASMPGGVASFAPTGADLDQSFQTIATIIRLRMTQ